MNHNEAGEILRASVAGLAEPLKSAIEFTLTNFYQPSAAVEAKNFLSSVPYEVFMARDLREKNPELKARIDAAYYTLMNDEKIWLSLEDLPHEQWHDVVDYEGLYQVSSLGRVKSMAFGTVKIRKPVLARPGYFGLVIYKNNLPQSARSHVLVARAFIPNPEDKPEVNHRFGNKLDNRVSELEWATQFENIRHACVMGLMNFGCERSTAKLTAEQVRYIRRNYIPYDKDFGVRALARKFNVHYNTITLIIRGDTYKNVT